jgi:hypothetical protein
MMFGQISNQNQAAMVQLLGAADQQMAAQSTGGMMSQTPQGVDAQQAMVDITTNNYQKAMENFFSQYCSYALTIYFQELKSIKVLTPTADVRKDLIDQGISPDAFVHEAHVAEFHIPDPATGRPTGQTTTKNIPADGTGLKDGQLQIDFKDMAVLYYVQCVPGSLVELEDEKQLRILKEIFVPLSQAMPAIAQAGDPRALKNASNAMQYIIEKTISLSGSSHASELARILNGQGNNTDEHEERILALENAIGGSTSNYEQDAEINTSVLEGIMGWMSSMHATMQAMAQQMGIQSPVGPPAPGGQPVAPTAETQAVPQSNAEPATV